MKRILFATLTSVTLFASSLEAAYVLQNGRLVDAKDIATLPLEEHYQLGITAIKKKDWEEAITQFRIITTNFPDHDLAKESHYFLGISYYHTEEMDCANESLTEYLKQVSTPKYFEQTFQYKLAIADAFKNGAKKHLFGSRKLPQIVPDEDLAITLYDEVANTFPNHDFAARALLSKAALLCNRENYRGSIETYQTVVRKFSRSEYAVTAYIAISETYLKQAQNEHQNPDLLALAQINIKKFSQEFPRDPRTKEAETRLQEMKEAFASAIYETGGFYERKHEPKASLLYYHHVVSQFPETEAAKLSKQRIGELQHYAKDLQLPDMPTS